MGGKKNTKSYKRKDRSHVICYDNAVTDVHIIQIIQTVHINFTKIVHYDYSKRMGPEAGMALVGSTDDEGVEYKTDKTSTSQVENQECI